jgi:hypothetical protein
MSARGDGFCRDATSAADAIRYGRHAHVGASFWDSPGAQSQELGVIDRDVHAFDTELAAQAQARGYRGVSSSDIMAAAARNDLAEVKRLTASATASVATASADKLAHFYAGVWLPFLAHWKAFYDDNQSGSWWSNPEGQAEDYQAQLQAMRQTARELGAKLLSPEPQTFAPSFFDPHHGAIDELGSVVKYGLYGALGLAGLFVGVTIYNKVK